MNLTSNRFKIALLVKICKYFKENNNSRIIITKNIPNSSNKTKQKSQIYWLISKCKELTSNQLN